MCMCVCEREREMEGGRERERDGEEEASQHSFVHKWTSLPSSSSAASRKHQTALRRLGP